MTEPTSKHPTSPVRPTHRIHRSITEISPPSLKTSSASSSRPHHFHNSSHHHHYHNSRRARSSEKEVHTKTPMSAHPNLQGVSAAGAAGLGWRDGVKTEAGTPADSRRQSGIEGWAVDLSGLGKGKAERVVKEGEVKEERERGRLRNGELRTSLINLNTLSNDQTSRLDNTYYSVLEKLSFLQSSIAALKEIASLTHTTTATFRTDSADLVDEMRTQIAAFDDFKSQETRITALAERVQAGREKIAKLGERVEVVSRKVNGYESAERKWQERTRRRLRVMWIVMSVLATVVVGLVVFRYTPSKTYGPGVMAGWNASEAGGERVSMDGQGELWSLKREMVGEGVGERLRKGLEERERESEGKGEEGLRVFDEL